MRKWEADLLQQEPNGFDGFAISTMVTESTCKTHKFKSHHAQQQTVHSVEFAVMAQSGCRKSTRSQKGLIVVGLAMEVVASRRPHNTWDTRTRIHAEGAPASAPCTKAWKKS